MGDHLKPDQSQLCHTIRQMDRDHGRIVMLNAVQAAIVHPGRKLFPTLMQQPAAQTGKVRLDHNDVGTLWDPFKQFSYMISKSKTQNHVQRAFSYGFSGNQQPGLFKRVVTAMKEKLTSVTAPDNCRRYAFDFGVDYGNGKLCLGRHGRQFTAGGFDRSKQNSTGAVKTLPIP